MNKVFLTALALLLLLFTGRLAGAQTTARARIADTPIRGEANAASAIIATFKAGDPVEIVDLQGDWYRVLVPGEQGKPRVGYVLAHLIDVVNADGSAQSAAAAPARPVAQGPPIPPTRAQLPLPRDIAAERKEALRAAEREHADKAAQRKEAARAAEREHALKVKVDALQAELKALQDAPSGDPVVAAAGKIDPRLAAVRKAFVVPVDELGDDRAVALCVADHLAQKTPIETVMTKDEADVIFLVKAHLPGATQPVTADAPGGAPSADMEAQLPDGTKLWADVAQLRPGSADAQALVRGGRVYPISCGLADGLLDTLLDAMKKAGESR
jgi:hypothetical protein